MDLSPRTEQAAASQESAAAMDEISATVKATSEQAREAAAIAERNAAGRESGGEIIGTMVETMHGIHAFVEQDRRHIIGVTDGIAFQTKTRAQRRRRGGPRRRGRPRLAVVATEVRAPCSVRHRRHGRSSLITTSVEQVDAEDPPRRRHGGHHDREQRCSR